MWISKYQWGRVIERLDALEKATAISSSNCGDATYFHANHYGNHGMGINEVVCALAIGNVQYEPGTPAKLVQKKKK